MKKRLLSVFFILACFFFPVQLVRAGRVARPQFAPAITNPYALIDEVNALRAANGLAAYAISPILMTIAQQHAEYMAVNGVSHFGAGGTRPYQRALNAGYPLAGDLTLGGFMSENVIAGVNQSVQQAVQEWQGDAPHLNTMLSPNLTEIGAGVVVVGATLYYVIDCAHPTSSSAAHSAAQTPSPAWPGGTALADDTVTPAVSTLAPSTPDAEGRVYHTVQQGETLWLMAVSYGVKVADLRRLNGLAEQADIYPGMKLLVLELPTPTSTQTMLPTALPTITLFPTSTTEPTEVLELPTPVPTRVAALEPASGLPVLGLIILAALVLAGLLAAGTRVRR